MKKQEEIDKLQGLSNFFHIVLLEAKTERSYNFELSQLDIYLSSKIYVLEGVVEQIDLMIEVIKDYK